MAAVIGVVLGWLLASVGQAAGWYWRRREQARVERAEAMSKARLVLASFGDAEFQLQRIGSGDILWQEVGFATGPLQDQLKELVGSMTASEWNAVNDATRELQSINAMTAYRSEPDTQRLQRGVELAMPKVMEAKRALVRLAD